MRCFYRELILLGLFLLVNAFFVSGVDIVFENSGVESTVISVDYAQVENFYFDVSGSFYNGSYPSNITIDIGDDGVIDWNYQVYNSENIMNLDSVLFSWSDNPDSGLISLVNIVPDTEVYMFDTFGAISDNVFQKGISVDNGELGIVTVDSVGEQILSVTTNDSVVHAFVPEMNPVGGIAGLYVSEGGSTYYCNSNHDLEFNTVCNLSVSEALVSDHLARKANDSWFSVREPVRNLKMIEAVNDYLSGCGLPCDIPVSVSSDAAGIVTIDNVTAVPSGAAAGIEITEYPSYYHIDISPDMSLTRTGYFYGKMPYVYVVPVVASDDSAVLTENESRRVSILNESLVNAWDELSNYSHPMNFTFYTDAFVLEGYSLGESGSSFNDAVWDDLIPYLSMKHPSILIVLDVKDYFPNTNPYNIRRSSGSDYGLISQIYINGFSDTAKTKLYNYDSEILLNIVLHELGHSFIGYTPTDDERLFYSDHPASFTDLSGFGTYGASQSPTGSEGYYEIYSVMNQLRPYIAEEDIGNRGVEFSVLDKMLLGILSPFSNGNYVFYSGAVVNIGNRYTASGITQEEAVDLSDLYNRASDGSWWDVRRNSSFIDMDEDTSFNILKQGQSGRALWVFAEDLGHGGHYKVFNLNSGSIQNKKESEERFVSAPENLVISKDDNGKIVLNWSGSGAEHYRVYYADNVTEIVSLTVGNVEGVSVVTGILSNGWVDEDSDSARGRYYRVSAINGYVENMSVDSVGKYEIAINSETGAGQTMFSLPINQTIELSDIAANDGAFIYTVDEGGVEAWLYASYGGGAWSSSGGVDAIEFGKGYYCDGFNNEFNITNLGYVGGGEITDRVYGESGVGQTLLGWQSLDRQRISDIVVGANDGAFIYTVDDSGLDGWLYASYGGGVWSSSGGLSFLIPGKGYYFDSFNNDIDIVYERNRGR